MHENSDFLRLVVNSIRKDLDENNEINNCLALHAIANVGGTEMAEALCEDVHRLLISPYVEVAPQRSLSTDPQHRTSESMVKKKAALTLLRLYRKHPDVIPSAEWALRIVAIMDDTDLVGQRFFELAGCQCLHLSPGCGLVCYNLGDGARTRPPRTVRSLLSEGRGPIISGKSDFVSSGTLLMVFAANCGA